MNKKHLLVSALIGGMISIVLSNVPLLNLVNCLLCAGFWVGPIFAVWFYKKQNGSLMLKHAVAIGALAGVFSGIIGLILSIFGLAGFGGLISSYSRFLPQEELQDLEPLMTGGAGWLFNIAGVFVDIFFGIIGGLVGGALFKDKVTTELS
jgi:hypothetical protein